MVERPILMSGPLVKAALDGRKTQTRRLFKVPKQHLKRGPDLSRLFYNTGSGQYPGGHPEYTGDQPPGAALRCADQTCQKVPSPFGIPGDRLWVREAWHVRGLCWSLPISASRAAAPDAFVYRATPPAKWAGWRPSIHMPRWASRLSLDVLEVRVQRVQDISEDDARAEGIRSWTKDGTLYKHGLIEPGDDGAIPWSRMARSAREAFAALWDSLAPVGSRWADNPWVWAITFARVTS